MRAGLTRRPRRRGYSVMLVVVFLVVLNATLGMTYRRITTLLRLETARIQETTSEQVLLRRAAAEAMTNLASGSPTTTPFLVTIPVYTDRPELGTQSYLVTMTQAVAPADTSQWTVQVVPAP